MTRRWRNLAWSLLAAWSAALAPTAFAQDEDAPKKKAAPKEEKAASPIIRPQQKEADAPPPKEEIAAKRGDPTTLDEAWRAIDFELNFGSVDEARRLVALTLRRPDFTPDAVVALIEEYGPSLLVRMAATPELGDFGRQFLRVATDASRAKMRDAARIRHFIGNLDKSPSERAFAIAELRRSGEAAAPFLAEAIVANPSQPVYANALAQMPPRTWEAAAAMLDSGIPALQSAALDALAAYRVRASAEALFHPLDSNRFAEPLRTKAQAALGALGRVVAPADALRELVAVARGYYLGEGGRELSEPHEVWAWQDGKLVSTPTSAAEAAYQFGVAAAKKAYDLDPNHPAAQTALATLFLTKPNTLVFPPEYQALNNSAILTRVLAQAEADRRSMTARNAVSMLGVKDDPAAFPGLVAALNYPNMEVQFVAAQAVLRRQPKARFPGIERIVPILVRSLRAGDARSAVVGDGSPSRANQTGQLLRGAGYRPRITNTGRDAFRAAAEFGDVELIVLEETLSDPRLNDTLTSLRLDARTAGIPVVVFEVDPPVFSPPVVMRPVTAAEREFNRRKQDHQVYLEEARIELYANATTAPERETRRFKSIEERVDYLLRRLGYVTNPEEYRRLMAETPDTIAVTQPKLLDPLEVRQLREWYARRQEHLHQLRERHPNVILMPRVGKPESFVKAMRLFAPAEDGGPLTQESRYSLQGQAINWLKRIAAGEFPFIDVRPAAPMLAEMVVDPKVGPAAADALGLIPLPFAQTRLAEVALSGTQPPAIRAAALASLASSVTRVGRLIPTRTASHLIALGADAVEGPLGTAVDALARALGPQAQALLAKHRAGATPRPRQVTTPPRPVTGSPPPPVGESPTKEKKKTAGDADF